MKNKRFFRTFAVLLAAVILTCGFSVTAYAGGGEDIPTDDSNVITETPEPQPLTPEGNMNIVDDIEGDAAEDKQFIVVQSRGGNYFYIIIDKAAQGENTVHFLNQVDEADLMAIIEDENGAAPTPTACSCSEKCAAGNVNLTCPVCSTSMNSCTGKEAEPEPTDEPQPEEEKSGAGGLAIFLIIALLAGGGAFYYFKIMKPKQSAAKGGTDLDDFDFDDYDEDEPEADSTEEQEDDEE
ncbi:DUF4366 domain-containing protein [Bacteroides pyogenes]|uniref:DUF4366 domain-containing protein n=1 Tax=Bacteroides pyogenes TaxID=310300 RepID=UPI002FDA86CD